MMIRAPRVQLRRTDDWFPHVADPPRRAGSLAVCPEAAEGVVCTAELVRAMFMCVQIR